MTENNSGHTPEAHGTDRHYDMGLHRAMLLSHVLIIMCMLIVPAVLTAFRPKDTFSENQNRYLAKFPKLTVKKYYDRSFTEGLEKYLSDHFIGADEYVRTRTYTDMAVGKKDVNGVYILRDRMVEKIDPPDESVTQKNIERLNTFAASTDKPVFLMLVPTQADIYRSELPPHAPSPDQNRYITDVVTSLEGIAPIDVWSVLYANRTEYIYYRTDHHWTTSGAYLGYQAASRLMGFEAIPRASFDVYHAADDFRGTYYSKTLYEGTEPDRIDIYGISGRAPRQVLIYSDITAKPEIHDGMYFYEFLEHKDKYSVFFGTNQPMVTISTGRPGGRLLIFKDSYAHCLVPYLTEHYSEITMLDTRYIQTDYRSVADPDDYDQILLLYNVSTFMDGIRL
ncbi:MAG: hypothetical protein IKR73_09080 [Oscillospiraceae bacterium]|nr:hypothetical protein [Oscillospiraceae bacterium]